MPKTNVSNLRPGGQRALRVYKGTTKLHEFKALPATQPGLISFFLDPDNAVPLASGPRSAGQLTAQIAKRGHGDTEELLLFFRGPTPNVPPDGNEDHDLFCMRILTAGKTLDQIRDLGNWTGLTDPPVLTYEDSGLSGGGGRGKIENFTVAVDDQNRVHIIAKIDRDNYSGSPRYHFRSGPGDLNFVNLGQATLNGVPIDGISALSLAQGLDGSWYGALAEDDKSHYTDPNPIRFEEKPRAVVRATLSGDNPVDFDVPTYENAVFRWRDPVRDAWAAHSVVGNNLVRVGRYFYLCVTGGEGYRMAAYQLPDRTTFKSSAYLDKSVWANDYPTAAGILRCPAWLDPTDRNNWASYRYNPVMLRGHTDSDHGGAIWQFNFVQVQAAVDGPFFVAAVESFGDTGNDQTVRDWARRFQYAGSYTFGQEVDSKSRLAFCHWPNLTDFWVDDLDSDTLIVDGTYEIRDRASSSLLKYNMPPTAGSLGIGFSQTERRWRLFRTPAGFFEIRCRYDERLRIGVTGNTAGSAVLSTDTDDHKKVHFPNQWKIHFDRDGYIRFQSRFNGLFLTRSGNNLVTQPYKHTQTTSQQFTLTKLSGERQTQKMFHVSISLDDFPPADVFEELGEFYQGPDIMPRTLDFLRRDSTWFRHCDSVVSICRPSRVATLWSLYPWKSNVWSNQHGAAQEKLNHAQSLPAYFRSTTSGKAYGYGKNLHEPDPGQIFTDHFDAYVGYEDFFNDGLSGGAPYDFRADPGNVTRADDDMIDRFEVDLNARKNDANPALFLIGMKAAHVTLMPTNASLAAIDRNAIVIPTGYETATAYVYELLKEHAAANSAEYGHLTEELTGEGVMIDFIHNYLATMRDVDNRIGRIFDILKTTYDADGVPLWDKTIVSIWSDHGYLLGNQNHERGGAEGFFEGGFKKDLPYGLPARALCAFRVPGKTPRVIDEPVSLLDYAPTVLDLAGLDVTTTPMQGQSLRKFIQGTQTVNDRATLNFRFGNIGVTKRLLTYNKKGVFRLIQWFDGSIQLFHERDEWGNQIDTLNMTDLSTTATGVRNDLMAAMQAELTRGGQDTFEYGYLASTLLTGGTGNDLYVVGATDAIATIVDAGGGNDVVLYSPNANNFNANKVFTLPAGIETLLAAREAGDLEITGSDDSNTIIANLKGTVSGKQGDDFIVQAGGKDVTIQGGQGDDTIVPGNGNTTIDLGSGSNEIYWIDEATGDVYVETFVPGTDVVVLPPECGTPASVAASAVDRTYGAKVFSTNSAGKTRGMFFKNRLASEVQSSWFVNRKGI